MNSKERVQAAFQHRVPDRVPLWYGATDAVTNRLMRLCGVDDEEALMRRMRIDFRRVHERYSGPELPVRDDGNHERSKGNHDRRGRYYDRSRSRGYGKGSHGCQSGLSTAFI